jgi:hypothetical protein
MSIVYEYKIGSGGSPVSAGSAPPKLVTGLTPSTSYDFYLRAKNTVTGLVSAWVGPRTASTLAGGSAGFTFIGSVNHSGSGPTSAVDTTGARLIVIHTFFHPEVPVDSYGNTYTPVAGVSPGAKLWYCIDPTVGASHTFDTNTTDFSPICVEYFGATGTISLDTYNSGSGTGTAQPGSITPSVNNCVVIADIGSNATSGNTPSVDSGFTQTAALPFIGGTSYGGGIAYKIQTTAAAVNPTWTQTGDALNAVIASFKAV